MRALVLQAVKAPLTIEERESLEPRHGEVVVATRAAALNRRDFWITRGLYPAIQTPVVLGSDGAGTVTAVGEGVDATLIGQEVVVNPGIEWGTDERAQANSFRILGMPDDGTFATEIRIAASQAHPRPAHLGWHAAAALPLAGLTAYRAVFTQGRSREGEKVLITGIGGGVAVMALQFALAARATVLVTSSSPEKIRRALDLGATAGYDYTADDWGKRLRQDHGAMDLIVDGAGGEGYGTLLDLAGSGGRVVNYGATAGPPGRVDLFKIFWKQLHIIGSTMGSPREFQAMLDFVGQHEIEPVVDEVFPLEEGQRAIEAMKTSPQFGKLVLEIAGG